MPPPSPAAPDADLTTFSVKSAGKEMTSAYQVYSITISSAVNRIPSARIVLLDGSAPEETFAACESDDFAPGTQIDIEVGYHSQNAPVFSGVIVKQGLRQRSGGPSQLVLECSSPAIKMTAVRKNADHGKSGSTLTDSALMESLIQAHGLTAKVTATTPALPWITQFNCSDWDFLVIRAQINGMLVLVDGNTVTVKAPDFTQEPTLSVTYGKDILELQTDMDATTQWSGVQCSAWDPAQQAMVSATASPAGVNTLGSTERRHGEADFEYTTAQRPVASVGQHRDAEERTGEDLRQDPLSRLQQNCSRRSAANRWLGQTFQWQGLRRRGHPSHRKRELDHRSVLGR